MYKGEMTKREMNKTILETTDSAAKLTTRVEWVIIEQPSWTMATAYSKLQ